MKSLRVMPANSVDCFVTDPPYELGFMGKHWDNTGIAYSVEFWKEVLRVLKPGGYLLSFGGSRTYHRMACAIEDAGFEVRDQIMWIYGSGFPKSMDVSKAFDKAAGAVRQVTGIAGKSGSARNCMAGDFTGGEYLSTAPETDNAKEWQGWGTALKPAHEPICVARKPLVGTVINNIQEWGVGAINIDGCRVATLDEIKTQANQNITSGAYNGDNADRERNTLYEQNDLGRFPANVIHDGSEEVLVNFPFTKSNSGNLTQKSGAQGVAFGKYGSCATSGITDSGSAARFFYCAKASKADRGVGNTHPTVKPTELMRYLVRMVCPPGGTVVDPFNGSGSTGKACMLEGFNYIGMEQESGYVGITCDRNPEAVIEVDGEVYDREIFDIIYLIHAA